jgi:hypothetical protein
VALFTYQVGADTLNLTVAAWSLLPAESWTTYVNDATPEKPAFGVKVKLPSELSETTPPVALLATNPNVGAS